MLSSISNLKNSKNSKKKPTKPTGELGLVPDNMVILHDKTADSLAAIDFDEFPS
jgi:hypothetical protein